MNKLFDLNSPIMRLLSRLTDMVFLSILWVICCLPVITIGPATTAMYSVALKWARQDEVKLGSAFFQSFKKNFKQGVVLNIIFMVVGVILVLDYVFMSAMNTAAGNICSGCFFALGIWMLCIMFYTYPLQAQFVNTIRQTLLNAAILSMRKLMDTVIVFVLNMLPVIVLYISVRMFSSLELFVRLAPVWILVAPGVTAFLCAKRFAKLFDPYLPKEETGNFQETEE